jgi:hypothetical protein
MKPEDIKPSHWWRYNVLFFLEHFLGRARAERLLGKRERALLAEIDADLSREKRSAERSFEVIDYADGTWPEPLYDPRNPKVFRGAARNWECSRTWGFDYFSEQFGDKEVILYNNVGLNSKDSDQNFDKVTLREFISLLRAGSQKYLKFSRMVHSTSELKRDFDYEWLSRFHRPGSFGKIFYLFMGGRGTKTPIHNAPSATVFVQVVGEKRWTFYAPGDRLFLGVRPERRGYFYSNFDPANPNDPAFPLGRHARKFEVTLRPGDVLWFPPFAWHQVENLSDSIGVAYKFNHAGSTLKGSRMLSLLFVLSTKPFLLQSLVMSRIVKNDYIFVRRYDT